MSDTATATRQIVREDLRRSMPFEVVRAVDDGTEDDGLTLEGDAAVFNSPTVIDSWEGRFKEVLVPGSFKKTLRETTPRLQFDHGTHPLIGSIPIGKLTQAFEDGDRAVHVVARLADNWLIQPVRDAIVSEAVDGMSFRFSVVREQWVGPDGKELTLEDLRRLLWSSDAVSEDQLITRYIKELKCVELGPVVWPAYGDTSVGVRSQTITIDLGRLDRPETRSALARAVMLADRAAATSESSSDETAPLPEEHPETSTDAPPTDGHPSDSTTRSTTDDESSTPNPAADLARDMKAALARIHERNQA